MKRFYSYLSILIIPVSLILYSSSTGSPGGKSGSPLDGANCTDCHGTDPETAEGWITSDIPEEGYTAGETYTITVTGMHENVGLMGFELTAESTFGKVGEFAIIDEERTQFTNNDRAVTHTSDGIEPEGDTNTWDVEWTAPSVGMATITFYAAVNAANGNGSADAGDVIYLTSLEVMEISTGIGEDALADNIRVYPNPATDYVTIETPQDAQLQVVNFLGQLMLEKEATGTSTQVDVSGFESGIYFARIMKDGESITKRMVIN